MSAPKHDHDVCTMQGFSQAECAEFADWQHRWESMTPDERKAELAMMDDYCSGGWDE